MIEPLAVTATPPCPTGQDHTWQLVSVETDCGVEIREHVCTHCEAVQITG